MTTTQITGLIEAIHADFTDKIAPAFTPDKGSGDDERKRKFYCPLRSEEGDEFNLSRQRLFLCSTRKPRNRDTAWAY